MEDIMRKNRKISVLALGVLVVALSACGANDKNEKDVINKKVEVEYPEGYDVELAKKGPVDQEKKKIINKDFSFGNLEMKVSDAWKETKTGDVLVFILNDEISSHIQIEKQELSEEVSKDFELKYTEHAAEKFFIRKKEDLKERKIANKDIRGYSGKIAGDSITFGGTTYFLPAGKTLYRFSVLSAFETPEEDSIIFEKFLDTVKIK